MAQLNIGTKNALETRGPTGHSQKTTRRETKPEIVSILNTTLKLRQIELEDKKIRAVVESLYEQYRQQADQP